MPSSQRTGNVRAMDTTTPTSPSIVLVPGFWLGAWAWEAVTTDLRDRGHHVTAVTLPGLDPDDPHRASTTLAQQAGALGSAVDAAAAEGSSVVLVAHSGAGHPTSVLLDRAPTAVARVVYVDSGPAADRSAVDASVPLEQQEVPLPPFEQLDASIDGLSPEDLMRFRERAVPQPGSVMRETVRLGNDSRRDVPSTIIACSFPCEVMMQMAHTGHPLMAEVATLRDIELVDLPTGHWPMWSRPADLAAAIAAAAGH